MIVANDMTARWQLLPMLTVTQSQAGVILCDFKLIVFQWLNIMLAMVDARFHNTMYFDTFV